MSKEGILKASKIFHEMGDLYEELAEMHNCEDTKENQDKLATLTGKVIFKVSEMQELKLNL